MGRRPWLDSSWVGTGLQLTDTEGSSSRTLEVYQKGFPAGEVSLGAQTRMHHRPLTVGTGLT